MPKSPNENHWNPSNYPNQLNRPPKPDFYFHQLSKLEMAKHISHLAVVLGFCGGASYYNCIPIRSPGTFPDFDIEDLPLDVFAKNR
jgi:hypothetical protein